jgi:regulatory protein
MRRKGRPEAEDPMQAAREKCLRLLAARARSAAELRQRLRAGGFAEGVIEGVLADLAAAGLVDDAEFARAWVVSRQAAGGMGRERLRWELRRKGVSKELIGRVLEEAVSEEMELGQALALARKRLTRAPQDAKSLARLRRLLLSRGFGFGTVEMVMRRVVSEEEI